MILFKRIFGANMFVLAMFLVGTLGGCGSAEEVITDILELPEESEVQTESETADSIVMETVEPEVTEPATPEFNASLSGRVVDAVNGLPLAGTAVTFTRPGADPVVVSTDQDGIYEARLSAGTNTSASFSIDGYRTETYSALSLVAENNLNLGTLRLVSDDNAGVGTLTGTISNAVDGAGVEGLTLRFRQGINVTTGEVAATTTTDINGDYSVSELSYGNWTCEIVGVGFDTTYTNVIVLGNITQTDQNGAVSPNLSTGEIRIVLTWGSTPSDLDSHLTGPEENTDSLFHVYYGDRNSELVNLDVDDTSSFGPETVTIERQINGVYRYSVHNFSNNNDSELSASGARVQVFDTGGLIRDYQVPDGSGNLWTVFDMEGGNITTINTISVRTSFSQYFPDSAQAKVSAENLLPLDGEK